MSIPKMYIISIIKIICATNTSGSTEAILSTIAELSVPFAQHHFGCLEALKKLLLNLEFRETMLCYFRRKK
jgi:hypothetical protein